VLSDPQKKEIFDQYGEDGLEAGGGEGPHEGGMPGGFHVSITQSSIHGSFVDHHSINEAYVTNTTYYPSLVPFTNDDDD